MINTWAQRVVPKTANYTINTISDRSRTLFTNRGASGAITFTLPTLQSGNSRYLGWGYEFFVVVDQSFAVQSAAGKMVALNNAAATSVTVNTGGQRVGAAIKCIWDGTSWLVTADTSGVTYTIA